LYDELAEENVPEIWARSGHRQDASPRVVINSEGERLLSRRVQNDESELLALMGDVLEISREVLWAVDLNHGGAALLIGLLISHDQPVAYLTGLAVHQAAGTYRGEGKTDAKDAFVIVHQARLRRDLGLLRPGDEIAVDLRTLTTRRLDLVFFRSVAWKTPTYAMSWSGRGHVTKTSSRPRVCSGQRCGTSVEQSGTSTTSATFWPR
jgi:hypothetical protein